MVRQDNKESIVPIEMIIEDINDNAPIFTQPLYTATVKENIEIGHIVLKGKKFGLLLKY